MLFSARTDYQLRDLVEADGVGVEREVHEANRREDDGRDLELFEGGHGVGRRHRWRPCALSDAVQELEDGKGCAQRISLLTPPSSSSALPLTSDLLLLLPPFLLCSAS